MPNIQPAKPKPDPVYGPAIGASRGMRGGTAGEAVNRGFREGIQFKTSDADKKKTPPNKGDKLKSVDMAKAAANRLRGKM